MSGRIAVVLVLMTSLAAPAAALAANAGDNQYSDPFGSQTSTKASAHHGSAASGSSSSQAATTTSQGSGVTPPPASTGAASRALPYTGSPTWQLALLGVALLACGVALRRSSADRAQRP